MGALLDVPKTDKTYESGQGLDIRYGLSSMQGWRIEMEDAHCAKIGLPFGLDDWSFFAVFDGHAGQKASAYCAYNLLDTILQESYFITHFSNTQKSPDDETRIGDNMKNFTDKKEGADARDVDVDSVMQNCDQDTEKNRDEEKKKCKELEASQQDIKCVNETVNDLNKLEEKEMLQIQPEVTDEDLEQQEKQIEQRLRGVYDDIGRTQQLVAQLDKIKESIRSGFLNLDEKLRGSAGEDKSGTTAVCALISPTHYFFANCGDSRAVLSYRGKVEFATEDHKPFNPKEKDRIVSAGGTVMIQRVNGSLAVSRALGDFDYKRVSGKGPCEQLVSPEPEIHSKRRTEADEFLILACDGIWDVMTNEELCDFVRYKLLIEDDLEAICSSVIDVCLYRGSRDNMSIIIVVFKGAKTKCPEAVIRDQEDNNFIREEVLSVLRKDPNLNIHDLIIWLNEAVANNRQVPPGAGIESKRDLLNQTIESFHHENVNK